MIDLHPYDGQERTFRHDDADCVIGHAIVRRILELPPSWSLDGVKYEMSFFSGGIGIIDHIAVTLRFDERIVERPSYTSLERAVADATWSEELLWLLDVESTPVCAAAVAFINAKRSVFQPLCSPLAQIWFEQQSGVNHWAVFWTADDALSYLAFDQG